MEHLILGLLLLSPMTGYQVQQFIRTNLSLICSHSAGSVHTALEKLGRQGYVTAAETAQGGRRRKVFSITPAGREAFSSWIARPMDAGKGKNMELSRLFFLGLAKPEERAAAIRVQFEAARQGPLPPGQDWQSILRFQGYTLDYGIAAAAFEKDWYTRLLYELEEQP